MGSSTAGGRRNSVGLFGFERGVEDVAAASGQADQGGVVFLALGPLAVVVVAAGRVVQSGEGGQEQGAYEFVVARSCGMLTADRTAGAVGDRRDARVGGQVAGGGEDGAVAGLEQDAGPVLTPTPGIEVRTLARWRSSSILSISPVKLLRCSRAFFR